MMPKSVKRFSDDIMLYLFDLEADSDFSRTDLKSSGSRFPGGKPSVERPSSRWDATIDAGVASTESL
jgi:hypothetical protein